MKFKIIYLIAPMIFFFSCKKEDDNFNVEIQNTYKYLVETTIIKNQWHEPWKEKFCAGGACYDPSEVVHPSETISESEADYYIDTIQTSDTLIVNTYNNSGNEVIISGLLNGFLDVDYQVAFYLDQASRELDLVYAAGEITISPNYDRTCFMYDETIDFNFRVRDSRHYAEYKYSGFANRINE